MAYDLTEECDFLKTELEKDQNVPVSFPDKINFQNEIHSIMHAFGDVKNPLDNSVKLMHNILQNQMALLIKNAESVMKLRKGKRISHEDVLFLMRKNKVLLKRLLQFLFVEDAKTCLFSNIREAGEEFLPEKGERVSKCLRYLGFIENFTGDLTTILMNKSIVDHENMKRLKRKDLIANSMTQEEYGHFYEYTLRVSFCHKNTIERFTRWLQQCSCINAEIKPLALSIIHFLSRETVARIVDKALEFKSRKLEKSHFSLKNCTYAEDMFLELGQDLDKSENNLQSCSHDVHGDSSDIKNYKMETSLIDASRGSKFHENDNDSNNNSSYSLQKMNSISSAFYDSDSVINYPVSMGRRGGNVASEKNTSKPENSANSKSNFNSFSERKISNRFSVFNENLNDNAGTSERNHNRQDNFGLKNDCFFNTYCVIEEDKSSIMNCKSETIQVYSNVLLQLPDASKNINKESYFSLNFQDKALSICYDGSKTFEYGTNSAPKLTANTEDKALTSSCSVEFIDSDIKDFKTDDSYLQPLVDDFDKSKNHIQFATKIEMDSKVLWFPEEAITPEEIQSAFIHYQQPLPKSYLMKTGLQRKTNLVCLAI